MEVLYAPGLGAEVDPETGEVVAYPTPRNGHQPLRAETASIGEEMVEIDVFSDGHIKVRRS